MNVAYHCSSTSGASRQRRVALVAVLACTVLVTNASSVLASGDATQASCPNEVSPGFRSYLPDCRAYEMVSPPYKDGFPIGAATPSEGNLSGGAPYVEATSLGAFAGAPADTLTASGNDYLFNRTLSGWETTALDPSSGAYVVQTFGGEPGSLAVAADGTTLMSLHGVAESAYKNDLYRRTLSGAFSLVGPMLPASAIPPTPTGLVRTAEGLKFAGAATDLSHVLFYIRPLPKEELPAGVTSNTWSGDTTVANSGSGVAKSLYEYVGTGDTRPTLVGVDEAGHLISQCGIGLGGERFQLEGNMHNAIGAGGAIVFFTANPKCPGGGENGPGSGPPTFELFARVEGRRTVGISEPTYADCAACNIASPLEATFEGASQNGSKVFFTTSQPLLSSDTDATKDLYEYDFERPAGQRIIQASYGGLGDITPGSGAVVQGVAALSEDGSHAYFVARGVLTPTPNGVGIKAQAGGENLYLYERDASFPEGRTAFIATLTEADSGQWRANGEAPMNATSDGRFLVFTSSADLTPEDLSTAPQVFRYDAQTTELTRVSIGNEGYKENGNTNINGASIPRPNFSSDSGPIGVDTHPAVSSDGAIVVFASSDALTPQAVSDPTNNVTNVYEYRGSHVYLVSDGQTTTGQPEQFRGSLLTGISPSGEDIFFRTYGALVPQDTDSLADVYDARVNGGFPSPEEGSVCTGDACRHLLSVSPAFGSPATASLPGGENLTPSTSKPNTVLPKCKRGYARAKAKGKTRCVKQKRLTRMRHKQTGRRKR